MSDKLIAASRRRKFVEWVIGPASFMGTVLWLANTLLYGENPTQPAMLVLLFFALFGLNLAAPELLKMIVRAACVLSWVWAIVGVLFAGTTVLSVIVALFGLALFLAIPDRK
jgi:hypothetical protein